MRRVLAFFLICATGICATTAAMIVWQDIALEQSYRSLSLSAVSDTNKAADNLSVNWDVLYDQNDEVVGWLSVNGTPIDYPVVQTRGDTPAGFYLSHDFWRNPSGNGCLYLDDRSTLEGEHLMVFGHQTGFSNRMFSSLRRAWDARTFHSIGEARWSTPNQDSTFQPLCALKVNEDFDLIQQFSFEGEADVKTWLNRLLQHTATAATNAETLIQGAKQVLTLVTCADTIPGTNERTLVVFVLSE